MPEAFSFEPGGFSGGGRQCFCCCYIKVGTTEAVFSRMTKILYFLLSIKVSLKPFSLNGLNSTVFALEGSASAEMTQ